MPDGPGALARPVSLVLVCGTGTEVGKTWVGAALARALAARGVSVAARKPAQSFEPGDDDAGVTDAQLLAGATGEDPHDVCPPARWYRVALAPPMAAAALGLAPPRLADLVDELRWPPVEVGLLETAGGVRSPLADDGDAVDLATAVDPDLVVLVADARLGAINAVRLSAAALARWPTVVVLNRFDADDGVQEANRRWLSERDGADVVTTVGELAARLAPRAASAGARPAPHQDRRAPGLSD
jgi:dethiobiotin synthetase